MMAKLSRAEEDYLIARHIAEKGVALCKMGIARGGSSEQLQVDPAQLVQIEIIPETNLTAAGKADARARRLEHVAANAVSGVQRDVSVPERPIAQPRAVTPAPRKTVGATPAGRGDAAAAVVKERQKREGPTRRFETHNKTGKPMVLDRTHDAVMNGRTMFPSTVKPSSQEFRLLKSGEHQRKIGSHVIKGEWAQMPIFTLTLEERATCPRGCPHWRDCYGNHMHHPTRLDPDDAFMPKLERELMALNMMYRTGFVVRLHILGDFFSVPYVLLWSRALGRLRNLRIFGYTARTPDTEIGAGIAAMNELHQGRCLIRFSNHVGGLPCTKTIDRLDQAGEAIVCPAQTEKSACCGTCALCWTTDKTIAFLRH